MSDLPITIADPVAATREWFARLGACCARVDYQAARPLFAADVVSFGTRADLVTGLDALQANQWEGIWPRIAAFRFDPDRIAATGTPDLAWGAATWTSTGFDEAGQPFPRPGRATVILARRAGRWQAIHTHFSLFPGTPARTYGPGTPA
jgi:ketosteroid isomerase-like protein